MSNKYTAYRNYVHHNGEPILMVIGENKVTFGKSVMYAEKLDALSGLTSEQVLQVGEWIKQGSTTLVFDYVAKNRLLEAENEQLKHNYEVEYRDSGVYQNELAKLKAENERLKELISSVRYFINLHPDHSLMTEIEEALKGE